MADENKLVIQINGTAKDFIDEIDKVKKETESLEKVLDKTAKASAKAFAGFAASIALVTKSFADYETALVGVGKTTNIEGKRLEKFGKQFQKLASEIPVSTNELLGIAQAAGQLGVTGEENLLKFTDTIAKLGVATDLTGEQAATSLTRILNVTGQSIEEIDTFGSVIVALGNNFAATESEIVRVTNEVARSTAAFGVSASEAAGLATALKSVGIQAQLGGSVVGKAFLRIQKAINDGGVAAQNLANITGIAGDQLKQTFEQDSTAVFQAFINGLANLEGGTAEVFTALEAFGLKGDEVNKVLPVLAKNSELVGQALGTAAKETENATALNVEAEKAFATLSSTFQRTQNNAVNLATNIGEQLAPQVTELLESLNEVLKSLSELDEETLSIIATFIKWGTIITGSIASLATLAKGFLSLKAGIAGALVIIKPLIAGLITIGGAIVSAVSLPVIAATAAIGGLVVAISKLTGTKSNVDLDLDEAIAKSDELKRKLEANKKIAEDTGKDPSQSVAVQQIQAQIDELDKLIEKKQEAANQPIDLTRPTDQIGEIESPTIAGLEEQQIPFRPVQEGEVGQDSTENLKKKTEENQAIIDEATQKRIESAKLANEQLKQIQQARLDGATEEELEYLQRRQEIETEFADARAIKNDQERELALENLRLKHQEELGEIEEFENTKDERAAERREEKAALDAELRELDKEQQALFAEEDLQALQASLDTQQEAEKKVAEERLKRGIQERNKFKEDEIKFGTEIATLKKFFNQQEVEGVKSTSAQLAQLSRSRNSTLKGIGKAAARVNAAIATAEGAIKAYTSLAGIPIIGPALGAAAAGALIAFGVEQQAQISAAQTGGFVPQSQGGARDRTLMALEPDELVVPKRLANPFISAVGNPESGDFANDDASAPVSEEGGAGTLRLEGDLIQNDEFVTALATRLREQQEFENVRL